MRNLFVMATSLAIMACHVSGSLAVSNDDFKQNSSKNQLRVAVDRQKGSTIVDIYDNILVKYSSQHALGKRAQFAFVDGMRAKYNTCRDAQQVPIGSPRTTWIDIGYTDVGVSGKRTFEITRTLNYRNMDRTYRFSVNAYRHVSAELEPGVLIDIADGELTYTQSVGPIGMSYSKKPVQISYNLSDEFNEMDSEVQFGGERWAIFGNGGATFAINGKFVSAYQVGQGDRLARPITVGKPLAVDAISSVQGLVHKVASEERGDVEDLSVEDSVGSGRLCYADLCDAIGIICGSIGDYGGRCICQALAPNTGVCLN